MSWVLSIACLTGLTIVLASHANAQSVSQADVQLSGSVGQSTTLASGPAPPLLQFGFGDEHISKLGTWSQVRVNSDQSPQRYEITVTDGDDTPANYRGKLLVDSELPNQYSAFARVGKTYGNVSAKFFGPDDQLLEEIDLPLRGESRQVNMIASTRDLLLTIDPGMKLTEELKSSIVGPRAEVAVVVPMKPAAMPSNWLGLDGVDSLLITTSDLKTIEQLTPMQLDAIAAWVERGGWLVLSVGQHGEQLLQADGRLARFCPGQFEAVGTFTNSKRLEMFANSEEQLIPLRGQPVPASLLADCDGKVLVDDGKSHPLIVRQARGLGQIVFLAFDLDSPRILQWRGLKPLLKEVVGEFDARTEEAKQSVRGSAVSHFGYDDLIGQLRAPLDRFSSVSFISFTWIAILIALYILCIGPGDFFFLQRLIGKMELTWVTFPLISVLFCGAAFGIFRLTRPDTVQLNQLEIIDIDAVGERAYGTVWANLYSATGGNAEFEFDQEHPLGFKFDEALLTWHGLPGDGLGGMMFEARTGLLKSGYDQDLKIDGQRVQTSIANLPLQVSSTKPLFGQWSSPLPVQVRSNLTYNERRKRLTGQVTNPFELRLENCRVLFDNWAYILDRPLSANTSIDLESESKEKNLKSLLTRMVADSEKKNRTNSSPWDPTDMRLRRIADMMMFYDAAGGRTYTGMSHGYQDRIDMTDHLQLGRAILVGEIRTPGVQLKIDGQSVTEQYDETVTMVRLILPVKNRTADGRR